MQQVKVPRISVNVLLMAAKNGDGHCFITYLVCIPSM